MHIQTQSEWETEMSVKVLDFVRNEIYLDLRFLDIALSALTPKEQEEDQEIDSDGFINLLKATGAKIGR